MTRANNIQLCNFIAFTIYQFNFGLKILTSKDQRNKN